MTPNKVMEEKSCVSVPALAFVIFKEIEFCGQPGKIQVNENILTSYA